MPDDTPAASLRLAPGFKCQRCWKVAPEVGQHSAHPWLCRRCLHVVTGEAWDVHDLACHAFDVAFRDALALGLDKREARLRAGAVTQAGPIAWLPQGDWQHA